MGLDKNFNQPSKKPGFLGRIVKKSMDSVPAALAEWTMQFMPDEDYTQLLEIGCGDGKNIGRLLRRYTRARITAVENSLASVEKALENNKTFAGAGRCDIFKADASLLPVEDNKYDLAVSFETFCFRTDLDACLKEAYRALRSGGKLIISNKYDGTGRAALAAEKITGLHGYTVDEIADALRAAGFTRAKAKFNTKHSWAAVIAQK